MRWAGNQKRGRRALACGAVVLAFSWLAGCYTTMSGPSLLQVALDRTVEAQVGCSHANDACSGTAWVRLNGLESDAVPFAVAANASEPVVITLSEAQYALVPPDDFIAAEVWTDDATPVDSGPRSVGTVWLHRSDTHTQFAHRVSVASGGAQATGYSQGPSVSADGRYVAFVSDAPDLVADDSNGTADVFVHDRVADTTARVSIASDGSQANGSSSVPAISRDGRHIAFYSGASNLVPGDTNNTDDVFVHDSATGTTTRASVTSGGVQANGPSYGPSISGDGRYVTFPSVAPNLVPGDTNGRMDAFVHDRETGATTRVSVSSAGAQANDHSYDPSISPDGRHIAFYSGATGLVVGDTNGVYDVFVHDREAATTTRVSIATDGTEANDNVYGPAISADGRHVAFWSAASSLVPGDTNGTYDVFVHDADAATTTRVSVATDGSQANNRSDEPSISADGRRVAFYSPASNLVPGDVGGYDVFVHDRHTGVTALTSVGIDGAPASGTSLSASISWDGRHVAYRSNASNLVPNDTNDTYDVFVG